MRGAVARLKHAGAVGDVIGDGERHRGGGDAGQSRQAAADEGGGAGGGAGGGQRPDHPGVAVQELLFLDHRRTAGGCQARGDPLGGFVLAGLAGATLDRRQGFDDLTQRRFVARGAGVGVGLSRGVWVGAHAATRSNTAASPWPPPMHIVSRP